MMRRIESRVDIHNADFQRYRAKNLERVEEAALVTPHPRIGVQRPHLCHRRHTLTSRLRCYFVMIS